MNVGNICEVQLEYIVKCELCYENVKGLFIFWAGTRCGTIKYQFITVPDFQPETQNIPYYNYNIQ